MAKWSFQHLAFIWHTFQHLAFNSNEWQTEKKHSSKHENEENQTGRAKQEVAASKYAIQVHLEVCAQGYISENWEICTLDCTCACSFCFYKYTRGCHAQFWHSQMRYWGTFSYTCHFFVNLPKAHFCQCPFYVRPWERSRSACCCA